MTPAHSETAELINRLRQQLILAQVRIMELEDERDSLAPRLAECEALLAAAQKLADGKVDEAAHLGRVLAEAQARAEQLNALHGQVTGQLAEAKTRLGERDQRVAELERSVGQLASAMDAMKASRRWRWTSWLG